MSDLAEFARTLHESCSCSCSRQLVPVTIQGRFERLGDIRAVIFDVYGTLINYWRPGLNETEERPHMLQEAFRTVADRFSLTPFLEPMDPGVPPEKTLYDLYHGLVALMHENSQKKGTRYPEVKIETVWDIIVAMLKRRGFDPAASGLANQPGRYLAYTYNFYALGRCLYPGVVAALERLKQNGMVLGIVSNAQFYTPIDLTLLIRDQSAGKYDDMNELFDPDLTVFSFEYGIAKPDPALFGKLYDALYEYHILPSQTVFVGNDLVIDIAPAAAAGMKTAFFCGDAQSAYVHDQKHEIVPDLVFAAWDDLPELLSFHSQGPISS